MANLIVAAADKNCPGGHNAQIPRVCHIVTALCTRSVWKGIQGIEVLEMASNSTGCLVVTMNGHTLAGSARRQR